MTVRKYSALSIECVEVTGSSGAPVWEAARQALILALVEDRSVRVIFNDREYFIVPCEVEKDIVNGLMPPIEGKETP